MISIIENYLTEEEIRYILSLYEPKNEFINDYVFYFYGNGLLPIQEKLNIKGNIFKNHKFIKLRIHRYDESLVQNSEFHGHKNPYILFIYLNDNFDGGELEFENGVIVKPKKGMLVYITENELHRVKNCIGNRWVMVGYSNNDIMKSILFEQNKLI